MSEQSLRSNCSMAECFRDKSNQCRNEMSARGRGVGEV